MHPLPSSCPRHQRSWSPGWITFGLFVGLWVVYGLTATKGTASSDIHAPAVQAWRMATAGTPWLEGVLDQRLTTHLFLVEAPNGHIVADRMAGPILLSIPFYWLLSPGPASSDFSMVPAGIAGATLTAATVALLYQALRTRLAAKLALPAALAFGLATPTWSISADGPWTHTLTQFAIAGTAWASAKQRWWLAGAFMAVGMLGRPHLAVVAAAVGLGMTMSTRRLGPAVKVAIPTTVSLLVLLLWNHNMFGVWSLTSIGYEGRASNVVSGYGSGVTAILENYAGFLVAPDRGILLWTPVLAVLTPATIRLWRDAPSWSRWLALGGIAYSMIQLQMNYFPGGDYFYGYRLGLELLTCLVPLMAFALPGLNRSGRILATLAVWIQLAVIAVGAVASPYVVPADSVWHRSNFTEALRLAPVPVASLLICAAVIAIVTARRIEYMKSGCRPRTAPSLERGRQPDLT